MSLQNLRGVNNPQFPRFHPCSDIPSSVFWLLVYALGRISTLPAAPLLPHVKGRALPFALSFVWTIFLWRLKSVLSPCDLHPIFWYFPGGLAPEAQLVESLNILNGKGLTRILGPQESHHVPEGVIQTLLELCQPWDHFPVELYPVLRAAIQSNNGPTPNNEVSLQQQPFARVILGCKPLGCCHRTSNPREEREEFDSLILEQLLGTQRSGCGSTGKLSSLQGLPSLAP